MFNFKSSFLALSSLVVLASASPADLAARKADVSVNVQLCVAPNFVECITIPVNGGGACTNFVGGLTILNKSLSSVVVPDGFICTFTKSFSCFSQGTPVIDEIALFSGSYSNLFSVQGDGQVINFDNQASSFTCSPLICRKYCNYCVGHGNGNGTYTTTAATYTPTPTDEL